MMRFWAHAYPQTPDDAAVKGKVGAAPMIAGPPVSPASRAWYLSVPTAGDKKDRRGVHPVRLRAQRPLIDSALGLVARKSAFEK